MKLTHRDKALIVNALRALKGQVKDRHVGALEMRTEIDILIDKLGRI